MKVKCEYCELHLNGIKACYTHSAKQHSALMLQDICLFYEKLDKMSTEEKMSARTDEELKQILLKKKYLRQWGKLSR